MFALRKEALYTVALGFVMKKLAALTLAAAGGVFTYSLLAADFWQAKLFTDWSDKEVLKVGENSPWAKQVSIAMGGEGGGRGEEGGSGKGSRKGGGGGNNTLADDIGPGGGGGITLTVRWQSALPVKQALVRMKYGKEAGTSAEAKQILDAQEPDYVIVVAGLNRGLVRGDADEVKKTLMNATQLVIKGKEPIKPKDFRLIGQGRMDAIFAFPKTNPITESDKDVEFQCKIGSINLKQKFQLKDMLFNGKLEL